MSSFPFFAELVLSRPFRLFDSIAAEGAVMSPNHDGAISRSFIHEIHRRDPLRTEMLRLLMVFALLVTGCQSLQKRTSQESASCGALCTRAREAREQGNSDQANQYINEALRQKPSDVETRRQLAETMWTTGRRTEAVTIYKSLCEQQPKDPKLSARLTLMLWENDQHAEAAIAAMSVLELDPQSKDAWLIKARNETEAGQLDEALASYIRLSQFAPDDLTTLIELGDLHLKRGHPDRACPLFRSALQHPQSIHQRAEIEWKIGVAYARSQRWSVAVPVLERAISQRTASAEDWCLLSWTRMQSGDLSGAQLDLQRALERDPGSKEAKKIAQQLEASLESTPSQNFVTPVKHVE